MTGSARIVPIELDPNEMRALNEVATATDRSSSEVATDWVRERLVLAEPANAYPAAGLKPSKTERENDLLRARYRPDDVVVLLVGESAPAGGTFFYRGDSHLYYATREAFERALGPMPEGTAFLDKLVALGFWLWDLAEDPVDRKRGRPRRDAVSKGVARLAALLRETEPDVVVGVKASLEGPVRQAAQLARIPASRVRILPFPLYQWRAEYVRELAAFLDPHGGVEGGPEKAVASQMKLHEAIELVLEGLGGGPTPSRQVANEIVRRELYHRRDGGRPDYQQIVLRAKKYPKLFQVGPSGISLVRTPAERNGAAPEDKE